MPSVVANEDHPMADSPGDEGNATLNGEGACIDINEGPRIRVVSRLLMP